MTKVRFTSEALCCDPLSDSQIALLDSQDLLFEGQSSTRAKPHEVIAMSGVYVDDYLTAGPPSIVDSFMKTLRRLWKTSEPQYLTIDHELTFLGVTLQLTSEGILLHQRLCTEDLLQEHSPHITARRRTTSGKPGHFQKDAPLPPDSKNLPEHQEWIIKRAMSSRKVPFVVN